MWASSMGCASFPRPSCLTHTAKTITKVFLPSNPAGIQVTTKVDSWTTTQLLYCESRWIQSGRRAGSRTRWPDLAYYSVPALRRSTESTSISLGLRVFLHTTEESEWFRSSSQVWSPKTVARMPEVIQPGIHFSNNWSFCLYLRWKNYISFKLWHVASIFQPEYILTEGKKYLHGPRQ